MNYMTTDTFQLNQAETALCRTIGAMRFLTLLRRLPAAFFVEWSLEQRAEAVELMLALAQGGIWDVDVLIGACVLPPGHGSAIGHGGAVPQQ